MDPHLYLKICATCYVLHLGKLLFFLSAFPRGLYHARPLWRYCDRPFHRVHLDCYFDLELYEAIYLEPVLQL